MSRRDAIETLLLGQAFTQRVSVKLQSRYDSRAQAPVDKYAVLLLTGVNVHFKV